jgi:hypothetical protein
MLLGRGLDIDECLVRYRIHEANTSHANAIDDFEPWRRRHWERLAWQSREGTKAYTQMLFDLYNHASDGVAEAELERCRQAAIEKLTEYNLTAGYYQSVAAVSRIQRVRSLFRLVCLTFKLELKRLCPVLQSRNDH